MTNKLATLTALAALALSPAVALAQSPASPETTPPAATDPVAPPVTTAPAEKMPAPPATTTIAPNTPRFVDAQAGGQMLSSDLIGTDVVTANDEKLGDISDILFEKDGKAVAAVIDVGGFLGIGAKAVAVSFDSLTMAPTDSGNKIVVAMTKEELNTAPQFKTLAETHSASSTPSQ
jgi:hypothetical protein